MNPMTMARLFSLFLLLLLSLPFRAQELIQGHVVDEATGENIAFASVQYKNRQLAAITDLQGQRAGL